MMLLCCNEILSTYYEYFNNDNTISNYCGILHLHASGCMPTDARRQSTRFHKKQMK